MPATETQVLNQLRQVIRIYDQTRRFGAVTATNNMVAMQEVLYPLLFGDFTDQIAAAISASRARLASIMLDSSAAIRPLLRSYGQVLDVPETDPQALLTRIYDDYIANAKRVESRGYVFGAPAAVVGNGVLVRLNLDETGQVIENQTADGKIAECIADATSGAELWEEIFELRGQAAERDLLQITGSGAKTNLKALSARDSATYLRNASFSQSTPAGPTVSPTDITSWTSSIAVNGTNYQLIGGTGVNGFYRNFPGDTTPLALRVLTAAGTTTLSQNLETNRIRFSRGAPYHVQVAWRRKASATGTLTLSLGASSVSVAIGSGTNDVWNTLSLPLTQARWLRQFDQAGLTLSLTVTTLAVGNVDLDDVVISPMTPFDGSWYAMIATPASGNPSQPLLRDVFTWTDQELGEGINQIWTWRSYGRYLPSRPREPQTGVALADAGAGALSAGTYQYRVTFVDVNGVESGGNATPTSIVLAAGRQVSVTAIPTGTATLITQRRLYRTVANGAAFLLLTTIADNVTTIFADSVADGALGAAINAGITFTDPA